MEGIQNGSEADFDILYHRYAKKLMTYFYNMLNKDEDKARDFLQELFIKILDKSDQFDGNKNFAAWAFTMASNMCKNEYRKLDIRKEQHMNYVKEVFYFDDTASGIDISTFHRSLAVAVERLDQEKKELYILRFEEEMSIDQIAEILDIKPGTVKSRLFYLKKELAKILKVFDPKLN